MQVDIRHNWPDQRQVSSSLVANHDLETVARSSTAPNLDQQAIGVETAFRSRRLFSGILTGIDHRNPGCLARCMDDEYPVAHDESDLSHDQQHQEDQREDEGKLDRSLPVVSRRRRTHVTFDTMDSMTAL